MKIALVAMSGIRVCDESLLELGLTLPGFVERSKVIASLPSLGLLTLAGMTPKHHDLEYIEIIELCDVATKREQLCHFDLVAISTFSAQIQEAYWLADSLREANVPVVMGGLHVTCCPKEAKEHCDSVIIGEGELSWLAVLEDVEMSELQPFYGSVEEEFDLADAPMPAFELLDINKYNRLTVQTSRGCPHSCEFCASSVLLTSQYKQKPAEKVLAEIDKIIEMWEHPFIELADDNTFVNKSYWLSLLPELAKRKIRWFTETDVSIARDVKLLKLMRASGCAQVLIGFESPSISALEGLEQKNNWKAKQLDQYRDAIETIQSHGISVNGCFILGLDCHDSGIFDEVYQFVMGAGLHEVQITFQTAFPGTALYDRLNKEGRIIEEKAWEKCTLFDVNFRPAQMTPEELTQGFRDLSIRLYSDECTALRGKNFKDILRRVATLRRKE